MLLITSDKIPGRKYMPLGIVNSVMWKGHDFDDVRDRVLNQLQIDARDKFGREDVDAIVAVRFDSDDRSVAAYGTAVKYIN